MSSRQSSRWQTISRIDLCYEGNGARRNRTRDKIFGHVRANIRSDGCVHDSDLHRIDYFRNYVRDIYKIVEFLLNKNLERISYMCACVLKLAPMIPVNNKRFDRPLQCLLREAFIARSVRKNLLFGKVSLLKVDFLSA